MYLMQACGRAKYNISYTMQFHACSTGLPAMFPLRCVEMRLPKQPPVPQTQEKY